MFFFEVSYLIAPLFYPFPFYEENSTEDLPIKMTRGKFFKEFSTLLEFWAELRI